MEAAARKVAPSIVFGCCEQPASTALRDAFLNWCEKGSIAGMSKLLSPSHIAAELQLSWVHLKTNSWLPKWLAFPTDRGLRGRDVDHAYVDFGNEIWEQMFWASNMQSLLDTSVRNWEKIQAIPSAPYGETTNKSAKGPVNARGNIIEGLLSWAYGKMQHEKRSWPTWRPKRMIRDGTAAPVTPPRKAARSSSSWQVSAQDDDDDWGDWKATDV
jgi:hypothetical protein